MLAVAGVPYCTARELYDVSWSYYVELKAPAEKALDMLVAWKETPKVMIALTPQFIRRCVVGLLCICQVSVERIVEFFDEVFCYHISKGSVGRIQEEARQKAEGIERDVSLRGVKYVAMDEIFWICKRTTLCWRRARRIARGKRGVKPLRKRKQMICTRAYVSATREAVF